jgi:hypothetical protein
MTGTTDVAVVDTATTSQDEATWLLTVPVPTVGLRRVTFPAPHLPHPDLAQPRAAADDLLHGAGKVARTLRERLSGRERAAFYGGLAALTAAGAISLPVAAAIGAGVWVAGRGRGGAPADGT